MALTKLVKEFKKDPFRKKYLSYEWIDIESSGCYWDVNDRYSDYFYGGKDQDIKYSLALSCYASHSELKTRIKDGYLQIREGYFSIVNVKK